MKPHHVTITSRFDGDLAEVINYFVDRDAVETASRFLKAVDRTIDSIALFPTIGTPIAVRRRRGLKMMIRSVRGFRNYLIGFRQVESGVLVQRLIYGTRDLPNQL